MTTGLLFLLLGLTTLLVVLFKRAAGIAMVGSVASLGVATAVVIFSHATSLPELVGLLFVAVAGALWVASPTAEDLAEPLGGTLPFQHERENPEARSNEPLPPIQHAAPAGDTLSLVDHLWLVGLPLTGFLLAFIALDRKSGILEGIWFKMMTGAPGTGFAVGSTDIAALFGHLLIFPTATVVLTLPLTGLVAVLAQLGKNRPTAGVAAMEYSVTVILINLVSLVFRPLP